MDFVDDVKKGKEKKKPSELGVVTHVAECPSSKHKALSSNPSTNKQINTYVNEQYKYIKKLNNLYKATC
jgi:hypothetical protein